MDLFDSYLFTSLFEPHWVEIGFEARCHVCGEIITEGFTYGDARYYCSGRCLSLDDDIR